MEGRDVSKRIVEENQITQSIIAQWLSISTKKVEYILRTKGADEIVDMLADKGHYVEYNYVPIYIKFYTI